MKTLEKALALTVGLVLASNGCADLRPPAGDKEAWEAQQKQEAAKKEAALEKDPVGNALYISYALAQLGYVLSGAQK